MFCEQCLLIPPVNKHSVDEVMVAYTGTRADTLHQYVANNPNSGALNYSARPVLLAWSMTCCSIRMHPGAAADSGRQSSDNVMEIHKQPHLSVVFFFQFRFDPEAADRNGYQVHRHCPTQPHRWSYVDVGQLWTLATSLGQAQAVQSVSERCVQMTVPEMQCVPLL